MCIPQYGQSALCIGSRYGQTAAVKFLLGHGAYVNLTTLVSSNILL